MMLKTKLKEIYPKINFNKLSTWEDADIVNQSFSYEEDEKYQNFKGKNTIEDKPTELLYLSYCIESNIYKAIYGKIYLYTIDSFSFKKSTSRLNNRLEIFFYRNSEKIASFHIDNLEISLSSL